MADTGTASFRAKQIKKYQTKLKEYYPGKTFEPNRPKKLPEKTRIGLFGAPGVGKSALINSFHYVTGDKWDEIAPESFTNEEATTTLHRDAYDLTERLVVCDNRGMAEFSQKYLTEVEYQLGGARRDGESVVWDRNTVQKLVAHLKSLRMSKKAKKVFEIHVAVIVVSAKMLVVNAEDMADLIKIIEEMGGQPPVFIITNMKSASNHLEIFKEGLKGLGVKKIYEVENYTRENHYFDQEKHADILKALVKCTKVADMSFMFPERESCSIL